MNKMSVKLRVTLWYTLVMVIMSVILFTASSRTARSMIENEIRERLVSTVEDTSRRLPVMAADGRKQQPPRPPRGEVRLYERGVHMTLFNKDGSVLQGQIPFGINENELTFEDKNIRREIYDGNEYYVYDVIINTSFGDGIWLKGMVSASDGAYAAKSTEKTNYIFLFLLIIIAALGGYFIISRAFVPVEKIRSTAKEISESSNLSQRINMPGGKDEISRLADTFDEMLDKIEQTLDKEKQFTSDASHELRTPVAVIMSECEYMLDCAETPDEFRESAASVKRQAERMTKLISELLTISRMDKNTMKLNFEETDISELVSFVCAEQEEINGDRITLIRDIKPDVTADADRFMLARLFINLVSNAYQYTPDGGTIKVLLDCKDDEVVFSVLDSGIGISQDNLPKIWERFYRADPSRTDGESSGLGLSMVRQIAVCHNGTVAAESEEGSGSVFIFRFPQKR